MKSKKGEGYVSVCVLVIAICMLLSVFITFASAVNVVRMTEQNSRVVLDDLVMRGAINVYDSIKKGNDENAVIDSGGYTEKLCSFCTLAKKGNLLYAYDDNRNEMFRLSVPSVGYTTDRKLKIYASYTVYVPLYFCGVKVGTATVPITVESKYTEKF